MAQKPTLAIQGGTPIRQKPLPTVMDASGHTFGIEEEKLVIETLRSGRLTYTCGTRVESLEKAFATRYGMAHCVACSSGTAAVHIALGAIGIEPGDEVIVPPITDMGSVIGILYQNAIPVFADVDPQTMTLDPESVAQKITERTRAVIPVHLLGNACEMDKIMELAAQHNLSVIEDCAQAYLTQYHGRLVGTIGVFGCFSLMQSKHLTAGDGGLTITNDPQLAHRAKLFSDKGWERPLYKDIQFLAPNYRLSELLAAVALGQLGKLDRGVQRRQELAGVLTKRLQNVPGVLPPVVRPGVEHSYWQYAIFLNRPLISASVYDFGDALKAEGIPCLPGYTRQPMYNYPVFRERRFYGHSDYPYGCSDVDRKPEYRPGLCPNTEKILQDVIVLPWNERYRPEDVEDIARGLEKVATYFSQEP